MSFAFWARVIAPIMLLAACGHGAPDATLGSASWVDEADIGDARRIYLTVSDQRPHAVPGRDLQPLLFDKLNEGFTRQDFVVIRRVAGDFCELNVQLRELEQDASRDEAGKAVTAAVAVKGKYGRNILAKTYREETVVARTEARAMTEPDLLGRGLEQALATLFGDEELRAFLVEHCTPEKPARASM